MNHYGIFFYKSSLFCFALFCVVLFFNSVSWISIHRSNAQKSYLIPWPKYFLLKFCILRPDLKTSAWSRNMFRIHSGYLWKHVRWRFATNEGSPNLHFKWYVSTTLRDSYHTIIYLNHNFTIFYIYSNDQITESSGLYV